MTLREIGFTVHGNKASISAIDPPHIAICQADFTIAQGPDEPCVVYVKTDKFGEVAGAFDASKEVIVEIGDGDFVIKQGRRRRSSALLDPNDIPTPKVPKLDWPCIFKVETAFLRSCMKATPDRNVSSVKLSVSGGKFVWSQQAERESFEDSVDVPGLEGTTIKSSFSPEMLKNLLGPIAGKEVTIKLGEDIPIVFEYVVNNGMAAMLLAPRIEEGA